MKKNETPYQAAKRRKLTYVKLRVDQRTQNPKGGSIELEGPVSASQAREITKLIVKIARSK